MQGTRPSVVSYALVVAETEKIPGNQFSSAECESDCPVNIQPTPVIAKKAGALLSAPLRGIGLFTQIVFSSEDKKSICKILVRKYLEG